ncbi:hypothetical protein EON65_47605 [archaeon]|nr:MAG: hypothetical protein EON65_47605 [archaeon]
MGIVIVLLLIEILAALWYSISYIPFARKMIIAYLRRGPCQPCFQVYDDARESMGFQKNNTAADKVNNALSNVTGNNAKSKGFSFLRDDDAV